VLDDRADVLLVNVPSSRLDVVVLLHGDCRGS
jgi:hypothetical protein